MPQNPSLPKLNLTNQQREQIRKTVLIATHNEVEFRQKATTAAKDFTPAVGVTLTALGHEASVWQNANYERILTNAILWSMRKAL